MKYNEKKSRSGTGSSQRERRCAVCQVNLQVQKKGVQFSQRAQPAIATRSIAVQTEDPAWERGDGEEGGGRDLFVGLADAHGRHFDSHSNDGPSGRRAIATPMALNPKAVLAGTAGSAAQLSARPGAVSGKLEAEFDALMAVGHLTSRQEARLSAVSAGAGGADREE